jgi:hypothetical protein
VCNLKVIQWEELAGIETVIFDNGMEQPIGGGSVIVHKK